MKPNIRGNAWTPNSKGKWVSKGKWGASKGKWGASKGKWVRPGEASHAQRAIDNDNRLTLRLTD